MGGRSVGSLMFACLLVVGVAAPAQAHDLKLHPSGFGKKSYASWKANEGLPDSNGNANQALYLQKGDAEAFAGALAIVRGFEGRPVSDLTGPSSELSWAHRDDGRCDTSPFWGIRIIGASGARYSVRLSCGSAAHSVEAPGWTRDSYAGAGIAAAITSQGGSDALAGSVADLSIVFLDGEGTVFLDNIRVNDHLWTSAADNGN